MLHVQHTHTWFIRPFSFLHCKKKKQYGKFKLLKSDWEYTEEKEFKRQEGKGKKGEEKMKEN